MKDRFRTIVDIPKQEKFNLSYSSPITMIGSCFAENIGQRLKNLKFDININPFGIQYNPLSIANAIANIIYQKEYTQNDLRKHDGIWHSFDHHGSFSNQDPDLVCQQINVISSDARDYLKQSKHLIVTFGTAWIYEWAKSGQIVSNCHKLPAKNFSRRRMEVNEIVATWKDTVQLIQTQNPSIKFIFTVSPIRHLKDGPHENQLSKATLLLAINQIISYFNNINIVYYPSYEIIMDELRDYRFYTDDMTHISQMAETYIFDRFCETFMNIESQNMVNKVQEIIKATKHRFIKNNPTEIKKFANSMIEKINLILQKNEKIDLKKELYYFTNLISK